MAEYTIIKNVTEEMLSRLRDGLCPGIISERDSIGASNDLDSSSYILNLYLYNITKADASLINDLSRRFTALRLEYMLAAQISGGAENKTANEQAILGMAAGIFGENPFIYLDFEMPMAIEMNNLSLYDKNSISPKKPALFYYVAPVLISIKKEKTAPRVIEVVGE